MWKTLFRSRPPVLWYEILYYRASRPAERHETYETTNWGEACAFMKSIMNSGYTIARVSQEVRHA
jgi:hypothetical protein